MGLYLRKAAESDAETLFQWRNDPEARANSFHTEPIKLEEHIAWLSATLRDPAQEIFILCEGETPIGQVRLATEGGAATVSYSIDAAYRVQGYGKAILQLAENLCVKSGKPLIMQGFVKKQNVASQVIFEGLGYTKTEESERNCLLYVKRIVNTDII